MWIDTHAHLYLKQFDEDREQVLQRARATGVERILLPDIDEGSTNSLWELVDSNPEMCFGMSGLHPCSVAADFKSQLLHVEKIARNRTCIAIGEIGLDYYWDTSKVAEQQAAFEWQIQFAKELGLPIVIHSRDSLDDTIGTVEKMQDGHLRGVFHCFNGSLEQMKRIEEVGFQMGLGGVITFKNAKMDDVIQQIRLDHIVFETDAPYLSPVPYRGKRNESSYVPHVARHFSEKRGIDISEVERISTENAMKLFFNV